MKFPSANSSRPGRIDWEGLSPKGPPFSRLIPFVFFPGGDSSADMALGLVFVEYFLDLLIQSPINGGKALA